MIIYYHVNLVSSFIVFAIEYSHAKMAPIPLIIIVTIIFSAGTMAADSVVATKEYPARCTSSYCEDIEEDICRALPPNCTASQSNFFGWEALSPDPCNCCPYCFAYLGVDDICPIGQATGIVPTHICGPGLYCVMDEETAESRCKTSNNFTTNVAFYLNSFIFF